MGTSLATRGTFFRNRGEDYHGVFDWSFKIVVATTMARSQVQLVIQDRARILELTSRRNMWIGIVYGKPVFLITSLAHFESAGG